MNDDSGWGLEGSEGIHLRKGERTPVPWWCAACGEANETMVEPEGGFRQEYTEDCAVCCRPNLLRITVDSVDEHVTLTNELEYE